VNEWPELDEWFLKAVQSLQTTRVESIHIDHLLQSPLPDRAHLVALGWTGLDRVIGLAEATLETIRPMLVIPLLHSGSERWADSLDPSVPDLTRLTDWLSPEPPALYLIDRTTDKELSVEESYRTVIPYSQLERTDVCVHAEYVTMRGADAIAEGWREFRRDLRVSVYPWSLVPPSIHRRLTHG
jgi:hypothetical protein